METLPQHEKDGRCLKALLLVLLMVLPLQIAGILVIRKMTPELASSDFEKFYRPAAQSILQGRAPVIYDGRPMTNIPIGYPAYIASLLAASNATGISLDAWIIAGNVACNLATVLAVCLLAWRLAGVRAAVAAGLLAGLYPLYLYLSKQGLPQVLCVPLAAWSLYLISRGHVTDKLWYGGLAGVLLGVGGLIWPASLTLVLTYLLYLLVFARGQVLRRLARPALLLAAFVLVVLPWEIHLYRQTGKVLPLSDMLASRDLPDTRAATANTPKFPTPAETLIGHWRGLRTTPGQKVRELAQRAGKSWYASRSGRHQGVALMANLPYMLLLPIGFVVGMARKQARWGAGLASACLLAMWGVSTLTQVLARLTAVGVILSTAVSAIGLVWLLERARVLRRLPETPTLGQGSPE